MDHPYCFHGTFQQIIGFLDTIRGRTVDSPRENVRCQSRVRLQLLYFTENKWVRSIPRITGTKLARRQLVPHAESSRLVATDVLVWASSEKRAD